MSYVLLHLQMDLAASTAGASATREKTRNPGNVALRDLYI